MRIVMPVSLRQLGEWLLFSLLFALLGFGIVRSAADLWQAECPATDTVFQRQALPAGCPEER